MMGPRKPLLVVALILLLSCSVVVEGRVITTTTPRDEDKEVYYDDYSFDQYLKDYYDPKKSSYATQEEYWYRKEIFEHNLAEIQKHNNDPLRSDVSWGINSFMDVEISELPFGLDKHSHPSWQQGGDVSSMTNNNKEIPFSPELLSFEIQDTSWLPPAVDWRSQGGVVTPVKSQGHCGSCWAFASVATLESHIAINTGKLFSLSPQELVSCTPNTNNCGGHGGCTGSTAEIAFDFVSRHGMVEEWQFGYQSYNSQNNVTCSLSSLSSSRKDDDFVESGPINIASSIRASSSRRRQLRTTNDHDVSTFSSSYYNGAVVSIEGYTRLPSNNYTVLMNVIAKHGPVAVNVAATPWRFYKGGVFKEHGHSLDNTDINHVVVLVGYGTDENTGEDYWLVRNSWGPLWGEDGYIRLKRIDPSTLVHPDADCGMDLLPADGIGCTKDDDGKKNDVIPPAVKVCGTSGIMFDGVIPLGGHLI